ncbi:MAG TPA: SpoIIE family protein phosphatase [Bryobacteraceae bacterium]
MGRCTLKVASHFQPVGTNGIKTVMARKSCIQVESFEQFQSPGCRDGLIERDHGIFGHALQEFLKGPESTGNQRSTTRNVRRYKLSGSQVRLDPGDLVVAYTDGVIEAVNSAGEEWGVEGLPRVASQSRTQCADDIVRAIFTFMDEYSRGRQTDDATVVVARAL